MDTEPSKVEGVLLDMDGTLVDSNALHAESWRRAFAQHGISLDFDTVLHQIGKDGDQLLPVFMPKEKVADLGKAIEGDRKQIFEREYLDQVKPFPMVRQLIERMKESGLRIALASSGNPDQLQRYKKVAQIDDLIEEEATSEDAEKSKPHPDIFAAALERLKLRAEQAVAIGDTPWDAEACAEVGVRAIGFTSGGWSREDLQRAGCVEIYSDPADLLARYDSSLLHGR